VQTLLPKRLQDDSCEKMKLFSTEWLQEEWDNVLEKSPVTVLLFKYERNIVYPENICCNTVESQSFYKAWRSAFCRTLMANLIPIESEWTSAASGC